jgi:predicted GTPase
MSMAGPAERKPFGKCIIHMGAAGRDFHDFNTYWRDNDAYEVVAFTATQIPDIDGRVYPAELSGPRIPNGSRFMTSRELPELIAQARRRPGTIAYSDLPHEVVMHKAALVNACGATSSCSATATRCSRAPSR